MYLLPPWINVLKVMKQVKKRSWIKIIIIFAMFTPENWYDFENDSSFIIESNSEMKTGVQLFYIFYC